MPTYEYRCKKCKDEFECFQSILDEPLHQCPKCEGQVQRLISKNIGISFKGSGFYINDSRSKPHKKSTPSDSKKETKTEATATKEPAPAPKETATASTAQKK